MHGHGVLGPILQMTLLNDNTNAFERILIVQDRDNMEKSVIRHPETIITKNHDTVSIYDLQINMNIVVIGSPNEEGQIDAKLIRILPPYFSFPPGSMGSPPFHNPRD